MPVSAFAAYSEPDAAGRLSAASEFGRVTSDERLDQIGPPLVGLPTEKSTSMRR